MTSIGDLSTSAVNNLVVGTHEQVIIYEVVARRSSALKGRQVDCGSLRLRWRQLSDVFRALIYLIFSPLCSLSYTTAVLEVRKIDC